MRLSADENRWDASGAATAGSGNGQETVAASGLPLHPSSPVPVTARRAGVQMEPTYADFGAEPPRTGNVTITDVERS